MRRMATAMWLVMVAGTGAGVAQTKGRGAEAAAVQPATRYFEVTLVLRLAAVPGREARVQSLTTDLAVVRDRPGASSGRARVVSQVPVTMQKGPTYLDLGTKLDCNDVRVEGNALAMAVVLETSAVNGTVRTVDKEGRGLEEPLISQRNLQMQVRLPLGKPTVVFDAKGMDASRLKPLPGESVGVAGEGRAGGPPASDELQVEMTARELP